MRPQNGDRRKPGHRRVDAAAVAGALSSVYASMSAERDKKADKDFWRRAEQRWEEAKREASRLDEQAGMTAVKSLLKSGQLAVYDTADGKVMELGGVGVARFKRKLRLGLG